MSTNLALPTASVGGWKGADGKLRPEAYGAMLVLLIMVATGVYFWSLILPFLIGLFVDTLHLCYLGVMLAVIGYLLFAKRPRLVFRVLIRKLTSIFVSVYPIEIIEDKLQQMKKKKAAFDNQVGLVDGAIQKLQRVMQHNQSDYNTGMRNAAQAHKMATSTQDAEEAHQLDLQTQLMARKAERRKTANLSYADLLTKLQGLYKNLKRFSTNIDYLIQDTQDDVDQKKTEYETTQTAFGAFSLAMQVMKGSATEEDIYDQAFAQIENTVSSQLGMMDHMQDLSENFMRGMDIQNGAVDEQALNELSAFETKLLTPGTDPALKMVTTDMSQKSAPVLVNRTSTHGGSSDYSDLLQP